MSDYTFRLSPAEFAATREKVAKIEARAAKRGFTGGLKVTGERVEVTSRNDLGFDITEIFFDTTITGNAPSYAGWTFAARVDVVNETFTIATAPGVDYISRDQVRINTCDHCETARSRKNIYLVRNDETGEIKNIGSTCIKDFLGWDAMPVFISTDDVTREFEGGFGGGERSYSVDTILAIAQASIRAFGWVPASSYDGIPTRSDVSLVLSPPVRINDNDRARLRALEPFIADAAERAVEVKAFILSDEFTGTSTFIDNLKVAAGEASVTSRQIGILAYAPQALIKARETAAAKAAREAALATRPVSEFQGNVGGKITVSGTIDAIRYIGGNYGTTVLYTISTDKGLVKWFASREALGEKDGVQVRLTGTVKKHDEYQGVKSTVLTRCKIAS